MLPAPIVAALYGARLGVGPLTMLTTWLWWAAMMSGALISVWAAAAAGFVFAIARVAVNDIVAARIATGGLPVVERLGSTARRSWLTVDGGAVVGLVVVALLAAGCVSGNDVSVEGTTQTAGDTARDTVDTNDASTSANDTAEDSQMTTDDGGATADESDSSEATAATADSRPDAETADSAGRVEETWQPSAPEELSALLLDEVTWFNRLTEPGADVYVDIETAAQRQPDPSEEGPLLETRGFLGGWSRVFRNDTQDVVVAQVYEFKSPTDADFYLEDGFITLTGHGAQFFDLESLPGVRGFRQDGADDIGPIVNFGLAYSERNRWYLLTLTGDPETATLDILIGAMEAQRAVGAGE